MDNNIVGETSKQVGSFIDALKSQPLSLALVMMNFLLMAFLFYSGTQRKDTVDMIVKWQQHSDQLMASCVSADIMAMILKALDRDRSGNGGRKPPLPPETSPKQP